ncbi:MAG: AraC family transcriptional regulator [Pseudomonadota bacterium]|nr:AraC family transcriptional regulator [Pseudomonadota bacterium]
MDVLSDVMRAIRLTGAIYFDVNARAPWMAATPEMSAICGEVMPDFEHVIAFHIMLDGWCWARLTDGSGPVVRLEAGDAIIFPAGDSHVMGTERDRDAEPDFSLYYRPRDRALPFVLKELGGEGEKARFVCGYLGCDAKPFNPILEALPRLMHIRRSDNESVLTLDLIRLAITESASPKPGGETILSKLSELIFLQAIRKYMDEMPPDSRGWVAGLRDRHVGEALLRMHSRPAEDWTLDSLAREVGMSRSVFADRFAQVMGTPAMQYLSQWRLQLAARLLERPNVSIAQAAADVGYGSEAAFNRAFKKQVGVPPGQWRRTRTPAEAL